MKKNDSSSMRVGVTVAHLSHKQRVESSILEPATNQINIEKTNFNRRSGTHVSVYQSGQRLEKAKNKTATQFLETSRKDKECY